MQIDLNLTITAIIALVALISPIVTTMLNNYYNLKKQKIDTCYSKQCIALDNFIKYTLNYYGEPSTWGDMSSYTAALNNLYLYFDNIDDDLFSKLDEYRAQKQLAEYKQTLNIIVKNLSQQISKT